MYLPNIWSLYKLTTNYVAPELEGSSPRSQKPATGPCPEPTESSQSPSDAFSSHSPIYASVFRVVSFLYKKTHNLGSIIWLNYV
jgi:hypothetical protein